MAERMVYYYGIPCILRYTGEGGGFVLIPEQEADAGILSERGFLQNAENIWQHIPTADERNFILSCNPRKPVVFGNPPDDAADASAWNTASPERLTPPSAEEKSSMDAASVFLLIVSVFCMGSALAILYAAADGTGLAILYAAADGAGFSFLLLAALITFGAVFVRASKNRFVRLIGLLYILISIVLVYQLITAMLRCTESCGSLVSCQWQKCK